MLDLTTQWRPASGATPGTATGATFTASGTASHPALAATNLASESRRTRFTSLNAANAVAGLRSDTPLAWRGTSGKNAGFFVAVRFTLAANASGGRAFIGLTARTTDICAIDPSTVTVP